MIMDISKITAAIWPWGTETREQMETAAREVTAIGYKSFESVKAAIYAYDLNLMNYREVLNRYDLKPVSFYFHLPPLGEEKSVFENLENELEFVAALDVKLICLQATGGRPEKMTDENMYFELELIKKFAQKTKEFGITSNLHPHHNTWVMYEGEIDNILKNLDESIISFAPDTAHMVAGNCDPVAVIKKYANRVNFTHFKDIKNADLRSEGMATAGMEVYSNFCELGKGCVDFRSIFDILKSVNYDGHLCEELDTAPISNEITARNNFDYLVQNY